MGGLLYALRYSMGGDAGTLELAVPDVKPGDRLTMGAGRQLLVLDVVYFDGDDAAVRGLLEVEEVSAG